MPDAPRLSEPMPANATPFLIDMGLVQVVSKAVSSEPWTIFITASSPRLDHEGEKVLPQAIQEGAKYFLNRGVVTYEHLTAANRANPEIIIGHPTDIRFTPEGKTLVSAVLYKHQPKAQAVWQLLQSGARLGASIGGAVIEREDTPGRPSTISKIWLNHLAITPFPVNEDCQVQLTPYQEFIAKALGTSDAAPLVREDLQGNLLRGTPDLPQKWEALTELLMQRHPGLSEDKAREVAALLLRRRGELRAAYTAT